MSVRLIKYFMKMWPDYWMECEPSIGRAGRVEEIANAVAFLASPLAGFINGVNLWVAGGLVTSVN
jgi:3-oxoacyl-[acyl-carrier protein] reductase